MNNEAGGEGLAVSVPALVGVRLTLCAPRLEDFADYAAMWSDPIVVRHLGGHELSEEEAWARLRGLLGQWALLGFGFWIIRAGGDGAFVGEIGFARNMRSLGARFDEAPEMGWVLASAAHGKGLAIEAARDVLRWADERFERSVCLIHPENAASIKLAERLGFTRFASFPYRGVEMAAFERRRPAIAAG